MVTGYTVATLTRSRKTSAPDSGRRIFPQIGSQVYALVVSGQICQFEVIQNILAALAGSGISQEVMEGAKASTQSTMFQTLDGELQERAIQAVIEAVKTTYVLVLVAGEVMTLIVALCMKWERLFGKPVVLLRRRLSSNSNKSASPLYGLGGSRTLSI
jgi:hypothetical protein